MAIPSTYSHQGITLVRGASCSLVDIPTYLGPTSSIGIAGKSGVTTTTVPISALAPRPPRPRLQLDLTKKNYSAKSTRKTKWTILCVGLTLLTMCVTLVGTMLSIGSQYEQNLHVARKWDHELRNKTANGNGLSNHQGLPLQTSTVASAKSSRRKKSTTSTTMSALFARLKEIAKDRPKNEEKKHHKNHEIVIQNAVKNERNGKTPAVGYRGKILRKSLERETLNHSAGTSQNIHNSGYKKKTS